ncbi:MAG: DUF5667 domain-containing protein [Candidatus Paceibacteria bacterium]
MNNEKNTSEYFKRWQEIKLSDTSRTRMKGELDSYVRLHGVTEGVRVGEESRFITQVPQRTSLFSLKFTYMPIVILIALVIGGGTSFAAQSAVPGDFLYPVKTEVNESVRSAFTFGADAEARLQAKLIEERVAEAKELEARGELEGEAAITLAGKMQRNTEKARVALEASTKVETQAAVNRIVMALTEYNATVENRTSLVIGISAFERIQINGSFASELATGEISVAELESITRARLSGLQNVVGEHQAEISANIRAELTANLERAQQFSAEAAVAAEADARRLYNEAAAALGEVESRLSTLGTVETNANTGAIINIDFSRVPVRINGEADTNATTSGEVRNGAEVNTRVDVGANASVDSGSTNATGSVRGGLGI